MRQVRVWLDDKSAGSGFRVVLEVSRGTKYAHFLQMPVDELARQERRGSSVPAPAAHSGETEGL